MFAPRLACPATPGPRPRHAVPAGIFSKNVLEPVVCLDLHCSNSRLAVGHRGGSFSCWKARVDASGKVEDLVLEAKHTARKLDTSVIKFSPDGNFIAVGFHDCVIDVYAHFLLPLSHVLVLAVIFAFFTALVASLSPPQLRQQKNRRRLFHPPIVSHEGYVTRLVPLFVLFGANSAFTRSQVPPLPGALPPPAHARPAPPRPVKQAAALPARPRPRILC
jgi:hypothetical protein